MANTPTPVAGVTTGTVAAESWGDAVAAAITEQQTPFFAIVSRSTTLSTTSGTWTLATYDSETADQFLMHGVTNTSRIIPNFTVDGFVRVNTMGQCADPATPSTANTTQASRGIYLRKNSGGAIAGGVGLRQRIFPPTWGQPTPVFIHEIVSYTVGDYYETFFWQSSGATLTFSEVIFQLEWVSQ